MDANYKTETRHHPRGRTCHHFARFRITCDEYDRMRARAKDLCELCGTPEEKTGGRRLVIDHFMGRPACYVRGLLCDRCNAVMACYDGNKPWGPKSEAWREQAERYAAASWHTPEEGQHLARLRGPIDRLSDSCITSIPKASQAMPTHPTVATVTELLAAADRRALVDRVEPATPGRPDDGRVHVHLRRLRWPGVDELRYALEEAGFEVTPSRGMGGTPALLLVTAGAVRAVAG